MGGDTAGLIDEEIRSFIDRNYDRAETILKENEDILHAMSEALMKYETIDAGQIALLMDRKDPGPPADWGGDDGMDDTPPTPRTDASDDSDDVVGGETDPSPMPR